MKIPKTLPTQYFWRYVDELDGRGLDLSYPREVLKAVKRAFMNHGMDYFNTEKADFKLFINNPQDNIPYETTLSPNVAKAVQQFFQYRDRSEVYKPGIPSTDRLLDIFLEQDKYFSMCLALRKELPVIVHNIKMGNYKYAAIVIASLTEKYNMEIVYLINDYFGTHKFFDKKSGLWYSYIIINNRTYIVSNEAYVAVLIYRYKVTNNIPEEHAELMYENYDVLTEPDKEHSITRGKGKSFLQDCKKVALKKKELTHSTIGLIEFHDLIRYGGYNDSLLSIDNLDHVSTIFGHRKWLHQFFVALALYCDHYINLDDFKQNMNTSRDLIDPTKLKDLDLFVQTVEYFDSIYDSLIANPDNK